MSRKDYQELARIIGQTLAVARNAGGEELRKQVYESLYEPMIAYLAADNPRFDNVRFSYATGVAETEKEDTVTYQHIRTFTQNGFRLDLWETGRTDSCGKQILRYTLYDGTQPFGRGIVFDGEDFHASPLHATDSDATVASLLSFLSLGEGDIYSEYFDSYSPEQIAWRDSSRRDDLVVLALHLEGSED